MFCFIFLSVEEWYYKEDELHHQPEPRQHPRLLQQLHSPQHQTHLCQHNQDIELQQDFKPNLFITVVDLENLQMYRRCMSTQVLFFWLENGEAQLFLNFFLINVN